VAFYIISVLSVYPYVYWSLGYTQDIFIMPVFLLLNIGIFVAIWRIRRQINNTPDLFVNENQIIVHGLIYIIWTSSLGVQYFYNYK